MRFASVGRSTILNPTMQITSLDAGLRELWDYWKSTSRLASALVTDPAGPVTTTR